MKLSLTDIAKACHETNKALCESQGDMSQVSWGEAPTWQRESAINGVALHVSNHKMLPQESHEAWLAQKTREGWAYGKTKDVEKKLHPCFLPYDKLPPEQRAKDFIFKATVANFRPYLGSSELINAGNIAAAFYAAQAPVVAEANPTTSPSPTPAVADIPSAPPTGNGLSSDQNDGPPTTDQSSETLSTATDSGEPAAETPPVAEMAEAE